MFALAGLFYTYRRGQRIQKEKKMRIKNAELIKETDG
jgi:hypothetical protein